MTDEQYQELLKMLQAMQLNMELLFARLQLLEAICSERR